MAFKSVNRQLLMVAIVIFYLIPLLFFSAYSMTLMSHHKSWLLLSGGLLLIALGTLAFMVLLFYWEQSVRGEAFLAPSQPCSWRTAPQEAKVAAWQVGPLQPAQTLCGSTAEQSIPLLPARPSQPPQLWEAIEGPAQDWQQLKAEKERIELQAQQVAQDFADYKLFSQEQLKQKQLQIATLQQMMADQKTEMERRQEQIYQLDAKIHDLSCEIRTLLNLEQDTATGRASPEKPGGSVQIRFVDHPITHSAGRLVPPHRLLQKYMEVAQSLTGAYYCPNETSRYRDFSSSYYGTDQRPLFDLLRDETEAIVIVYSQREKRLLFANNATKPMLGWSPKKFVAEFFAIIKEGAADWRGALQALGTQPHAAVRLLAKTKEGQEVLLQGDLGVIAKGSFRDHILGILYLQ